MKKWFEGIKVVFYKETVDHFRDRRSLTLSLMFPLLAPLLVGALLYFIGNHNFQGDAEFKMNAYVTGAENAPDLIAYLEEHSITVKEAPLVREFQEEAVKSGNIPFILLVPEEARDKRLFNIEILMDRSSPQSMIEAVTLLRHIRNFSRNEGRQMIERSGLDPGIISPITVTETNIGQAPNTAFLFYNMIPSLLMFMIFMGAVYLAIDVSVGERERGSLETLLITPISRAKLLLGKSLSALFYTVIIVLINLLAFYIALKWATGDADNMTPPPGGLKFFALFLISIPLMMFAVSLQMTIAFMTKSAKEAQIYLGLLPIVPLLPGLIMVFSPIESANIIAAIPIYGQLAIFIDIMGDKAVEWSVIMYSIVGTLAFTALVFFTAARLFEREKIVLGN